MNYYKLSSRLPNVLEKMVKRKQTRNPHNVKQIDTHRVENMSIMEVYAAR